MVTSFQNIASFTIGAPAITFVLMKDKQRSCELGEIFIARYPPGCFHGFNIVTKKEAIDEIEEIIPGCSKDASISSWNAP
jgi:hypothetical protein